MKDGTKLKKHDLNTIQINTNRTTILNLKDGDIISYDTHDKTMNKLQRKKRIAEMKYEERKLKYEILKLYIPLLRIRLKFNKLIVLLCIVAIISYTIAAILLQKCTSMELSPTLTTCVYGFFGTELLGMAGIRIFDKKYETAEPSAINNIANSGDIINDDDNAVG